MLTRIQFFFRLMLSATIMRSIIAVVYYYDTGSWIALSESLDNKWSGTLSGVEVVTNMRLVLVHEILK